MDCFQCNDVGNSYSISVWQFSSLSSLFLEFRVSRDHIIPPPLSCSYSVGHNEVIGVCRVGNDADSLGRDHWSEMLTYPRKPVAHWHPLVEVRWPYCDGCDICVHACARTRFGAWTHFCSCWIKHCQKCCVALPLALRPELKWDLRTWL